MSKREQLQKANDKLKSSLDNQIDELKNNVDKIGKGALIVGGGLLGAYLLSNALTKSDKTKKGKKSIVEKGEKKPWKDNLLMSTVKEQAIIFLLGLATERLASFLKDLDKDGEA